MTEKIPLRIAQILDSNNATNNLLGYELLCGMEVYSKQEALKSILLYHWGQLSVESEDFTVCIGNWEIYYSTDILFYYDSITYDRYRTLLECYISTYPERETLSHEILCEMSVRSANSGLKNNHPNFIEQDLDRVVDFFVYQLLL